MRDQIVSGGEPINCPACKIAIATIGEPLGGIMSGGGFSIQGGGGSSVSLGASITAMVPADKARFYMGDSVPCSVTATSSNGSPLQIRFLIDGQVIRNWTSSAAWSWNTSAISFGWHTLRVEVKDSTNIVNAIESKIFIFWRPPA